MPVRTTTQRDYGRRIARAIAYLGANLDRAPSLEELAGVAAFSPFHFHRIYRAVTGETPAETQLRARLSRAAAALLKTSLPIARIARQAGYGSAAAFTRAFAAAHGVPPGAYRARGGLGGIARLPSASTQTTETAMYDVTIRDEPAMRLAAIRHVGAYDDIGGVFDRLLAWAAGRGLAGPEVRCLGLFHDDPATVPAARLRSDAGIVVPAGVAGEGEVQILELPAARVGAVRFRGPHVELPRAYDWLYGTWLPASGEEPADAPCVEEYLNDPRETPPGELLTTVMVPLRAA